MKILHHLPRLISVTVSAVCLAVTSSIVHATTLSLETPGDLNLHNVKAESVTYQGHAALRLTSSTPPAPDRERVNHLAIVKSLGFKNGTIEVDLAGEPSPGASGGARGFVGIAFRLQGDRETYDCFYLRPTNGRSDDQERRNHTVQYIHHPDHPWFKLRKETPSRYESYADITPATWINVRIEVDGDKARLFLDGNEQPTLIVNDLKSGADGSGSVAIWFEGSTVAHAKNLKIKLH